MFTNGKGTTKKSCLASALGEYFERLSCNYFFADFYLGQDFANDEFVHYPDERWFKNKDKYRKFIVVPGSAFVSIIGIYWFIERLELF